MGTDVGMTVGAGVGGAEIDATVRVGGVVGSDWQAASPTINAMTAAKTSHMSNRKS